MRILHPLLGPGNLLPSALRYPSSALLRIDAASNGLIALAYFTLATALVWFWRRRTDLPFSWVLPLFGGFLLVCGFGHALDIWSPWHTSYLVASILRIATAVASAVTAIVSIRILPEALELPNLQQWTTAHADLEREVREHREAEINLRLSEANLREQAELLELTHDAIFVRSLVGKILFWNRAAEELYGWSREEAQGQPSHELLHTEFPEPLDDILAQVIKTGFWEGELVHRRRDGASLTLISRWALRRDPSGEPQAVLETNRDITLRKIEANKFRNLLESAPDATVIVDRFGRIEIVNAQTEKLFGYSRNEMIGQPVEMLIPDRFRSTHTVDRERFTRSPHARAMGIGLDLHGLRKNGTEFPVEVSLSPLATGEGTLISSSIRDVTERRRMEKEVHQLNAALQRKLDELGAMNQELESFSYSVSHDLRAPLRHIDGFARILKEEHSSRLEEDGLRYLDRVIQAANHMGQLVDDLIHLARVGRSALVRQRTKLDDLVRQAMSELPEESERREIEWRIEPLPDAECDPGLLKLVFINLFSNAVKFTRSRAPAIIEVGTRDIGGNTALFVRDNGVGFDPRYADKLFGVFQRLHKQEEFEGTGIGLATVQRIVRRHGGEIWVEAQPERGATFFFTLGARPLPGGDRNGAREAPSVRA